MKLVSQTESMVVIEDDGGFLNFISVIHPPKKLTEAEVIDLNKKLDDMEIYLF